MVWAGVGGVWVGHGVVQACSQAWDAWQLLSAVMHGCLCGRSPGVLPIPCCAGTSVPSLPGVDWGGEAHWPHPAVHRHLSLPRWPLPAGLLGEAGGAGHRRDGTEPHRHGAARLLGRPSVRSICSTCAKPVQYQRLCSLVPPQLERPYSYSLPCGRFPKRVQLWTRWVAPWSRAGWLLCLGKGGGTACAARVQTANGCNTRHVAMWSGTTQLHPIPCPVLSPRPHSEGEFVREIAALPLAEDIPVAFDSCRKGPRGIEWRDDKPAEVRWCWFAGVVIHVFFSRARRVVGHPLLLHGPAPSCTWPRVRFSDLPCPLPTSARQMSWMECQDGGDPAVQVSPRDIVYCLGAGWMDV